MSTEGVVDIYASSFVFNFAHSGAGMVLDGGASFLRRVEVSHNISTAFGGGVIAGSESTLVVLQSALHDNVATGGSALYSIGADVQITMNNTTVSGNHSSGPGAIYLFGAALDLNNVTITANESAGQALIATDTTTASNTIIGDNISTNGTIPDCAGALTSYGNNLTTDASSCMCEPAIGDVCGVSPVLEPLANNGGETETHALGAASPALAAGNAITCLGVDQRGEPRLPGQACDIGAFEDPSFP